MTASGISNEFTCINNQCSCLDGECNRTCSSSECIHTYFICPSSATSCFVNCNGRESCKHAKFFGAAVHVILNCNGTDACSSTQVACGRQDTFPNDLPSFFTPDQFTGSMDACFINLLTSNAMRLASISCAGLIADCIIDAYAEHSISQSLFECNTDTADAADGNGCELNCIEPTNCASMQYICNTSLCSCNTIDQNCANPAINLTLNYLPQTTAETRAHDTTTDQYNCMYLRKTDIEIRSMFQPERDSTFHYEISGHNKHHQSILFRYILSKRSSSLSASLHDIYQSIYFNEHEEYGTTYDFKWVFNESNVMCWRTDELSALKIDLYYNKNISLAFTYIYSEEMRRRARGSWVLTSTNNWNLGVTYLENGFIDFEYEFNITLAYLMTMEPTSGHTTLLPTATAVRIVTEQSTTNSSPNNSKYVRDVESTTTQDSVRETQIVESTADGAYDNIDSAANNTDIPIEKLLMIGIPLIVCSIFCMIGCIVFFKYKRCMAAVYASSSDEDIHMIHHVNHADDDNNMWQAITTVNDKDNSTVGEYFAYDNIVPSAPLDGNDAADEHQTVATSDNMEGEHEGVKDNNMNVKQWLNGIQDLDDEDKDIYFDLFVENGFDKLNIVKDMNDNDLIQIGINKLGHRKLILVVISQLG